MKTEQTLVRISESLSVRQLHKRQLFCANDLLAKFPGKRLGNWMDNEVTQSFIEEICKRESLTRDEVIVTFRGRKASTWLHPMLVIDFAMWLSPEIKYIILKWAQDNLCKLRDNVGDNLRIMTDAIKDVIDPPSYKAGSTYAAEIYMVQTIAGVDPGGRNLATEKELELLNRLQIANANLIRSGVVEIRKREPKLRDFAKMFSG